MNTKAKEGDGKGNEDSNNRSHEGQSSQGGNASDAQGSHSGMSMMGGQGDPVHYHAAMMAHSTNSAYHNHHTSQPFHSSAFHPLPGGSETGEGGPGGNNLVASGTAVPTQ